MRLFLYGLLFLLSIRPVVAQDRVAQQMQWLAKAKPTTNLFVHFDKNVYANNEVAYFTGYLLKGAAHAVQQHRIMAVALIRTADNQVVLSDKFSMQNGLSFGSMTLPDSLLTGNYHFLVYTDKLSNGLPEAIFDQAITLKTNIDPAFKASMKLTQSSLGLSHQHQVLVSVTSKDNRFLPKPTTISYRYGQTQKIAKTDASGQLLISLPKQDELIDPNLYLKLKYEKDSSFISMALPQAKNRASVKFYPEGGNLVNGLPTNIGWEVKDQQQRPLTLQALLYQNGQVIDTIETGTYGIGKFKLSPKAGAQYTVKLVHDGVVDSLYHLPKAINSGLTLSISDAVVADTLALTLRTNADQKINIRIHNFRTTFINTPLDMGSNIRGVKIPLNQVNDGIAAITISDTLGRPLAERLFFAHYNHSEKIKVETDRQLYGQREKVNLKLKLDSVQKQGLISIAVVQDNRLAIDKMNDIETYTYLKNELNAMPVQVKGLPYKDKNYIEQLLLVKGWRRYTWQTLADINAQDTLTMVDSLSMTGLITKAGKTLTTPATLLAFDDQKMRTLTSTANGYFDFKNQELIMLKSKRNYIFLSDKDKYNYQLKINDQFKPWHEKLAKTTTFDEAVLPSLLTNNADLVLKGNEKAVRLKAVEVKSKKDNSMSYNSAPAGRTPFGGDYVCKNNILNCPNHVNDPGNRPAVEGRLYASNGVQRIYKQFPMAQADPAAIPFSGIHLHKEFYVSDYKDPQEPAFFSTIYWNYAAILNADKAAEISFYTSDIMGKFRIVVQGITNKDVIYAERYFEVKPKPVN